MLTQTELNCLSYFLLLLQIYDGYGKSSPILLNDTCGINNKKIVLKTSYRMAYIYFESDSRTAREGFVIRYRAELG